MSDEPLPVATPEPAAPPPPSATVTVLAVLAMLAGLALLVPGGICSVAALTMFSGTDQAPGCIFLAIGGSCLGVGVLLVVVGWRRLVPKRR
jgi:hypothetical protein